MKKNLINNFYRTGIWFLKALTSRVYYISPEPLSLPPNRYISTTIEDIANHLAVSASIHQLCHPIDTVELMNEYDRVYNALHN